jgi:hypothetical protein
MAFGGVVTWITTCDDITSRRPVVNDGGDVFTRFGFNLRLLDPDRASTMFLVIAAGMPLNHSPKGKHDMSAD